MKNNWLLTIVIAAIMGVSAFFGGTYYQKNQSSTNNAGQSLQRTGRNGNRRFGGATVGSVVSSDQNSITIQLMDGSSKIINISGNTIFSKTVTASKSDIQNGTRISAFGSSNSDGSITAQNVQINPMGMRESNKPSTQQ